MKTLTHDNNTINKRTHVFDRLNRPLQDLRISVIDQCNLRCPYCMPESVTKNHAPFLNKKEWLTLDQLEQIVQAFVNNGIRKCRLTGGEPLLRADLSALIQRLSRIDYLEDIALTTNGSLLTQAKAEELKAAGLNRITFSLDSLNSETFQKMCGGKTTLPRVLKSIAIAEQSGFTPLKINVVLQHNINENDCLDLIRHFKNSNHIIRFIEYMDVGNCNQWQAGHVVKSSKTFKKINAHFPLKPLSPNYFGEVAARYAFQQGQGEVGFISSVTQPFCKSCTRARLSVDGKLLPCLFSSVGTDLKKHLLRGAPLKEMTHLIGHIWKEREDRYSEIRSDLREKKQTKPKIEMFQIGG